MWKIKGPIWILCIAVPLVLCQHAEHHDHGSSGHYDSQHDGAGWDIRLSVPGEPERDYPVLNIIPQTGFTCVGRENGYYADEQARCQVFRVCANNAAGGFYSFLCPNGTLFNQRVLVCDWWMNVQCSGLDSGRLTVDNKLTIIPGPEMMHDIQMMISYPMQHPFPPEYSVTDTVMQVYNPPDDMLSMFQEEYPIQGQGILEQNRQPNDFGQYDFEQGVQKQITGDGNYQPVLNEYNQYTTGSQQDQLVNSVTKVQQTDTLNLQKASNAQQEIKITKQQFTYPSQYDKQYTLTVPQVPSNDPKPFVVNIPINIPAIEDNQSLVGIGGQEEIQRQSSIFQQENQSIQKHTSTFKGSQDSLNQKIYKEEIGFGSPQTGQGFQINSNYNSFQHKQSGQVPQSGAVYEQNTFSQNQKQNSEIESGQKTLNSNYNNFPNKQSESGANQNTFQNQNFNAVNSGQKAAGNVLNMAQHNAANQFSSKFNKETVSFPQKVVFNTRVIGKSKLNAINSNQQAYKSTIVDSRDQQKNTKLGSFRTTNIQNNFDDYDEYRISAGVTPAVITEEENQGEFFSVQQGFSKPKNTIGQVVSRINDNESLQQKQENINDYTDTQFNQNQQNTGNFKSSIKTTVSSQYVKQSQSVPASYQHDQQKTIQNGFRRSNSSIYFQQSKQNTHVPHIQENQFHKISVTQTTSPQVNSQTYQNIKTANNIGSNQNLRHQNNQNFAVPNSQVSNAQSITPSVTSKNPSQNGFRRSNSSIYFQQTKQNIHVPHFQENQVHKSSVTQTTSPQVDSRTYQSIKTASNNIGSNQNLRHQTNQNFAVPDSQVSKVQSITPSVTSSQQYQAAKTDKQISNNRNIGTFTFQQVSGPPILGNFEQSIPNTKQPQHLQVSIVEHVRTGAPQTSSVKTQVYQQHINTVKDKSFESNNQRHQTQTHSFTGVNSPSKSTQNQYQNTQTQYKNHNYDQQIIQPQQQLTEYNSFTSSQTGLRQANNPTATGNQQSHSVTKTSQISTQSTFPVENKYQQILSIQQQLGGSNIPAPFMKSSQFSGVVRQNTQSSVSTQASLPQVSKNVQITHLHKQYDNNHNSNVQTGTTQYSGQVKGSTVSTNQNAFIQPTQETYTQNTGQLVQGTRTNSQETHRIQTSHGLTQNSRQMIQQSSPTTEYSKQQKQVQNANIKQNTATTVETIKNSHITSQRQGFSSGFGHAQNSHLSDPQSNPSFSNIPFNPFTRVEIVPAFGFAIGAQHEREDYLSAVSRGLQHIERAYIAPYEDRTTFSSGFGGLTQQQEAGFNSGQFQNAQSNDFQITNFDSQQSSGFGGNQFNPSFSSPQMSFDSNARLYSSPDVVSQQQTLQVQGVGYPKIKPSVSFTF